MTTHQPPTVSRVVRSVVPLFVGLGCTLLVAFALNLLAPASDVYSVTFYVTNGNNSGPGSLRAAVDYAQNGDEIIINTSDTINLTDQITIGKNIRITGGLFKAGHNGAIDGGNMTRIFHILPNVKVYMTGLRLVHGMADRGAAIDDDGNVIIDECSIEDSMAGTGGAILTCGTCALDISDCLIADNHTTTGGAGITNYGDLRLGRNNRFQMNSSDSGSAVIYNGASGSVSEIPSAGSQLPNAARAPSSVSLIANVTPTLFISNSSFQGGAIANFGIITLSDAIFINNPYAVYNDTGARMTLSDTQFVSNSHSAITNFGIFRLDSSSLLSNTSYNGAAIYNGSSGAFNLTNSTLALNRSSGGGGAIDNFGAMTVTNSTLVSNTAGSPGGAVAVALRSVNLLNTLVANNSPDNCSGNTVSLGHNLEDAHTCRLSATGDQTDTNPLLGPLQDNGALLLTYAPLPGSPAIDAGSNSGCPPTDERGAARPFNGTCDIGAVEYAAKVNQTIDFAPLSDRGLVDSPFTLTATTSSGLPVNYSASGPCSVSGSQVTLTGTGTCGITAHQAGDATYNAAPDVPQSFQVVSYALYLPLVVR